MKNAKSAAMLVIAKIAKEDLAKTVVRSAAMSDLVRAELVRAVLAKSELTKSKPARADLVRAVVGRVELTRDKLTKAVRAARAGADLIAQTALDKSWLNYIEEYCALLHSADLTKAELEIYCAQIRKHRRALSSDRLERLLVALL